MSPPIRDSALQIGVCVCLCLPRGGVLARCVRMLGIRMTCLALTLAVLGPSVGRTMNRRSPCRSVVHFPDCIFELQFPASYFSQLLVNFC